MVYLTFFNSIECIKNEKSSVKINAIANPQPAKWYERIIEDNNIKNRV